MKQEFGRLKFSFEKKLSLYIEKHGLIDAGDKVLVALSGGSDSVCLIKALCELKSRYKIAIVASHVNHMIRGDEAERDERFCADLCKKLGIELEVKRVDVPKIAKEEKKSLELAAREVRYEFFDELCEKHGINKVATAHNKNDNAETVLMNFMRGSGIAGLCGIDVKRKNIIRPLLCMDKKEILDYIEANGLEYVTDSTNLLSDYTRNKIRLEMIGYIEKEFNPNFTATISRSCESIKADSDFLESEAQRLSGEYVKEEKGRVFIELEKMGQLAAALRYRIIRKAILKARGNISDIGFDAVKRIDELKGGKADVADGIYALYSYGRVYFEKTCVKTDYEYELNLGGKVYIKEDKSYICCEIADKSEIKREKNCVYFDCDNIKSLKVRNRRPGDAIKTEAGSKKIKNLFIDEKIPVFKRDSMPMVVCGDTILWICPLRRCSEFKINEKTKKVIKVKYIGEEK